MALRLACHDAGRPPRASPPRGQAARAVFDAVEQARVEAIGSRRMAGVAHNISAMLEDRYHRGGKYEDITDRADAPLEDAVALMVRERLTGSRRRPRPRKIVDLWRDWIEDKAGKRSRRARSATIENQRAFARTVRDLLASLDMADEPPLDPEDDENEDENDGPGRRADPSEGEAEERVAGRRAPRSRLARRPPTTARRATRGSRRALRRDAGRSRGRANAEEASRSLAAAAAARQRAPRPRLQGLHHAVRRDRSTPRSCATPEELDAPARLSRQAARPSPGRRRPPRQPAAAPADGAAEPRLGLRPRGGHARPGPPVARRHRPDPAALLQAGEGHRISATRW